MQNTAVLGLNKPTDADTFDQTPFNANADILEAILASVGQFSAPALQLNASANNVQVPLTNLDAGKDWRGSGGNVGLIVPPAGTYLAHGFATFPLSGSYYAIQMSKNGAGQGLQTLVQPSAGTNGSALVLEPQLVVVNGTDALGIRASNGDAGNAHNINNCVLLLERKW